MKGHKVLSSGIIFSFCENSRNFPDIHNKILLTREIKKRELLKTEHQEHKGRLPDPEKSILFTVTAKP